LKCTSDLFIALKSPRSGEAQPDVVGAKAANEVPQQSDPARITALDQDGPQPLHPTRTDLAIGAGHPFDHSPVALLNAGQRRCPNSRRLVLNGLDRHEPVRKRAKWLTTISPASGSFPSTGPWPTRENIPWRPSLLRLTEPRMWLLPCATALRSEVRRRLSAVDTRLPPCTIEASARSRPLSAKIGRTRSILNATVAWPVFGPGTCEYTTAHRSVEHWPQSSVDRVLRTVVPLFGYRGKDYTPLAYFKEPHVPERRHRGHADPLVSQRLELRKSRKSRPSSSVRSGNGAGSRIVVMVLPSDVETIDRQICLLAEFGRRHRRTCHPCCAPFCAPSPWRWAATLHFRSALACSQPTGKWRGPGGVERLSIGSQASFQGPVCGRIKKGLIPAFG
jgi:hypothetical protein